MLKKIFWMILFFLSFNSLSFAQTTLTGSRIRFTPVDSFSMPTTGQYISPRRATDSLYYIHQGTVSVLYPQGGGIPAFADSSRASYISDTTKKVNASGIVGSISFADSSRASYISDTTKAYRLQFDPDGTGSNVSPVSGVVAFQGGVGVSTSSPIDFSTPSPGTVQANLRLASASVSGIINGAGSQTIGGDKQWDGNTIFVGGMTQSIGTNSNNETFGAFGVWRRCANGSSITKTLPSVNTTSVSGAIYYITNEGTSIVNIATTSSQQILGIGTSTVLDSLHDYLMLIGDASVGWHVLGGIIHEESYPEFLVKKFVATVSQSGTSTPTTVSVSKNTIQVVPTWGRASAGVYSLTFSGALFNDNDVVFFSLGGDAIAREYIISVDQTTGDEIILSTFNSAGVATDIQVGSDFLCSISIFIYP
jgi:hypothetical protein